MKTKILLFLVALVLFTAYLFFKDHPIFNRLVPADATLPDNSKYYGALKDGLFDGQGELVWADGSRYEGHFETGLMAGSGSFRDNISGFNYEGLFKEGMMHGIGKITYYDGMEYQGGFKLNRMSGTGNLRYANGSSYEGVFENDVLIKGSHVDSKGNSYDGIFEDWLLAGYGSFTSHKGDVYTGTFDKGILNGQALITLSNGSRYEGEVSDWRYQGKGKLIDDDGNQYLGEFENGEFHGEGTLTLAIAVKDISEISGQWEFGYNPNDPRYDFGSRKYTKPIDELLYTQNDLLFDSISNLSSHAKNKIDMYFLGMAAHHEAVFYQEIGYIEKYFIEHFGSENKSVTLFNHPSKHSTKPLLTNHAIKTVLDGLASKMDVDQDLLFLYLTSHGKQQKISVSYPGLELSKIDAEQLGEVLKNSPIKWKVIMLSACYSGSFIPFLKDEHHLIMTAAREDRVSFGCGEGSDMTYFAKAMFQEALPQHDSFVAGFEAAKKIITEWENDDFPQSEHSEPQIFIGEKIETHLKIWRLQNH